MNASPRRSVAIVGLACRFPFADTVGDFAARLREGYDAVRLLPSERAELDCLDSRDMPEMAYLERIDLFDYQHFGLSLSEARHMDPHHRMAMELAHYAMQDAGYEFDDMTRKYSGVIFAAPESAYFRRLSKPGATIRTGNRGALLAGRIAYYFGLNGCTYVVDSACSSGLLAAHNACKMIGSGELDQVLVGAVNLKTLVPQVTMPYDMDPLSLVSPSFRCKTFDKEADGIGLGEGGAVLLLKALDRAEADGDDIWGIIRGSAANQDGNRSNGLTAPSPNAQKEVLRAAWECADIDPSKLAIVEAHGTGTMLGDPIELQALHDAFISSGGQPPNCSLGSVKSNIGHLGGASGLAGLVKVLLSLNYRELYPTIHVNEPTPYYDWNSSPFYLQAKLSILESDSEPPVAGVSSFGLSGTNVHAVVQGPARVRRPRKASVALQSITSCWVTVKQGLVADLVANGPQAVTVDSVTEGLCDEICKVFAEVLGEGAVPPDGHFLELGGNSMLAVDLLYEVERRVGAQLDHDAIYKYPTPELLAERISHLSGPLPGQISKKSPQEQAMPRAPSRGQQRIWISEKLLDSPVQAVDFSRFDLKGPMRSEDVPGVLQEVFARHSVLRYVFTEDDGNLRFRIEPDVDALPYRYVELQGPLDEDYEHQIAFEISNLRSEPPVLVGGKPLILVMLRLRPDHHVLLLAVHHSILDGLSKLVLVREITARLAGEFKGSDPHQEMNYESFIEYEERSIRDGHWQSKIDFWAGLLPKVISPVKLPRDRKHAGAGLSHGERHVAEVPDDVRRAVIEASKRMGCTPFTYTVSALALVLYRYSRQPNIVIGSPVSVRPTSRYRNTQGFFLNTLPLIFEVDPSETVAEFLERCAGTVTECLLRKEPPLDLLLEVTRSRNQSTGTSLFNVLFDYHNQRESLGASPSSRIDLSYTPIFNGHVQHDLEITLKAGECDWSLFVDYPFDAFDPVTIQRFVDCLLQSFRICAQQDVEKIGRVDILGQLERDRQVRELNRTYQSLPDTDDVVQLIRERAVQAPDASAVTFAAQTLSYSQLLQGANEIADLLAAHGVSSSSLVAVVMDRGIGLMQAVLGVFSCGAAYLPMKPHDPLERNRHALDESDCDFILTASSELVMSLNGHKLDEFHGSMHLARYDSSASGSESERPSGLAYAIFTSGSTGAPKGAMVERKGMVNHLLAKTNDLSLTESDVLLQNASQCFDISVWQMLAPLISGGQVVIVDDETARDPVQFLHALVECDVTVAEVVPSFLRALLEAMTDEWRHKVVSSSLRILMSTGEQLPSPLCRWWLETFPQITVVNAFGPTECSDDVTHAFIRSLEECQEPIPIGRPIQNMRLYVLDEALQVLPVGAIGELYVGGIGVGPGYVNNPKETGAAFLSESFLTGAEGRLYRTGDLVRYRPDNQLEFLGRLDSQVKLFGNRIELSEIENVILSSVDVCQVKVLLCDCGDGRVELVAFVVATPLEAFSAAALDVRIRDRLPPYMCPSRIIQLDALPLNQNGKVDSRALFTLLEQHATTPCAVSDTNNVEAGSGQDLSLLQIAQTVLGRPELQPNSNLLEYGATSLDFIRIVARAGKVGIKLTVRELMEKPWLAQHQSAVEASLSLNPAVYDAAPFADGLLLAPMQRWFFEAHPNCQHFHHRALLAPVASHLSNRQLKDAVERLVAHYDALRCGFYELGGSWEIATADGPHKIDLECLHASPTELVSSEVKDVLANMLHSTDLAAPPLMKLLRIVMRGGEETDLLIVAVHRLVCDSLSLGILREELQRLLAADGKPSIAGVAPATFSAWVASVWAEPSAEILELPAVRTWLENKGLRTSCEELEVWRSLNTVGTMREVRFACRLPEHRHKPRRLEEIVVAAMAFALLDALELEQLSIDIGNHGRIGWGDIEDVSDSVGPFAGYSPISVNMCGLKDLDEFTRRQLRDIRSAGNIYPWLRFCSPHRFHEMMRVKPSQVSIDFLGPRGQRESCTLLDEIKPLIHGDALRPYVIEILVSTAARDLDIRMRIPAAMEPAFLTRLQDTLQMTIDEVVA